MKSKFSLKKFIVKNPILMNMDKILYNRAILYIIFIISLFQLFMFASMRDHYSTAIFVLVGFLTSFFSKNMIVILTIALAVSAIMKYGTGVRHEGFEEKMGNNDNVDGSPIDETDIILANADTVPKISDKSSSDKSSSDKSSSDKSSSDKSSSAIQPPNISPEQLAKLKAAGEQYTLLMTTQANLTKNMKSINDDLTTAENIIEKLQGMVNK